MFQKMKKQNNNILLIIILATITCSCQINKTNNIKCVYQLNECGSKFICLNENKELVIKHISNDTLSIKYLDEFDEYYVETKSKKRLFIFRFGEDNKIKKIDFIDEKFCYNEIYPSQLVFKENLSFISKDIKELYKLLYLDTETENYYIIVKNGKLNNKELYFIGLDIGVIDNLDENELNFRLNKGLKIYSISYWVYTL